MIYEDLLDRIIADGSAEVRETYAASKEHHKRDGAIEGFEACRGKAPGDLVALWTAAEREAQQIAGMSITTGNVEGYWRRRYKAMQLEWVCNVVSVGLTINGQAPLLAHLPTARGAMKYAEIVGVHDEGISA